MALKTNYKEVLKNILNICEVNKIAPKVCDLKKYGITSDIKLINKYLIDNTEYKNYQEFCRLNGYKFEDDFVVNGKFKSTNEFELEDYIFVVKEFYRLNNRFPRQKDFIIENGLPSNSSLIRFVKDNNMKMTEFRKLTGDNEISPNDYSYEYWLNLLKEKCEEKEEPIKYKDITSYGLPSTRWFVQNCNNPKVTNYNEFIEYELNMNPRFNMSKEKITTLILDLQDNIDRPIQKKDLKLCGICESTVSKIWGSFNEMKESLGLEIKYKSRKANSIDVNKVKRDICRVCSYAYESEGRTKITQNDWNNIEGVISYSACSRWLKNNDLTIREFITSIGYEYIEAGQGLNYTFDDGEKTKSQYELAFSKYLRDILNLKYNSDYFREVRYNEFIENYNGLLDCDYIINYNNKKIYVEIAGMLRDYKNTYKTKVLNSKSKEKYRLKILEKEDMLKNNNLEYLILFPDDIKNSKLDFLFSCY